MHERNSALSYALSNLVPELVVLATAQPENLIIVENHANKVVIRAARDNYSERRKTCFMRYLATEGYIPDYYQWLGDRERPLCGLDWVADGSLLKDQSSETSQPLRQVLRVLFCAGLLWLALMSFAFLQAPD